MKKLNSQKGFSLIEILMVLILIAVLAAIAINAFVNFRPEAQSAALAANLKILRNGIAVQYAQMQLRCSTIPGVFPNIASINANDITDGNSTCDNTMVTIASEAAFVQGSIPVPPQGTSNVVVACTPGTPATCTRGDATPCDNIGFSNQWCYHPQTGEIWLDSATVAFEAL